eukprot:TRINITY_DN5286_c0_g1_i1.p1 TRINITY_DN5286_c0_g1~~TRINITY_DN5286_c0_g1_i1.p1  ORF type:complete len:252 (-),score=35.20 TRINITY_DN5286_c0_g1_i1:250-1005(-)
MQSLATGVPTGSTPTLPQFIPHKLRVAKRFNRGLTFQVRAQQQQENLTPAVEGVAVVEEVKKEEDVQKKSDEKPEKEALVPAEQTEGTFAAKELWEEVKSGENFGKRGEGFFLGQVLILALIFFPPFQIQGLMDIFSILLMITGLVSVWLAVFNLGQSLSPFPVPRKRNKLVTTGIYGIVRHPMYAGVLMVCTGLSLYTGGETRLLLSFLLAYLFNQKAKLEEKYLLEKYPTEYKEYMESQTKKRFIPLIF